MSTIERLKAEIQGWENKYNAAVDMAARAEIERDQLQSELNRIYHWIERRNQDGFMDSKGHVANLDIVWDALYDKYENAIKDAAQSDTDTLRALHERNEARVERDKYSNELQDWKDAAKTAENPCSAKSIAHAFHCYSGE